jgi:double-stranded uracil-DNA glycosylase
LPRGWRYGREMGFSRDQLESYRGASVPDLLGPECRLLFVGINPGLWTAATGTHFAHPGNRFYPALHRAAIIDREIDRSAGFTESDRHHLIARQIGITNIVNRATARASELSRTELRDGGSALRAKVERWAPRVVAVAGVTAFRRAFDRPHAVCGPQDERWGDVAVWVVPNPSGLNAHETIESLADWYGAAARVAGVIA